MPHLRDYISPSQIKTAHICMRRWHGTYVCGIAEEAGPGALFGGQVHEVVEAYYKSNTLPSDGRTGTVARALLTKAPDRDTPNLLVEAELNVSTDSFGGRKAFSGRLDLAILAEDEPTLVDFKTTSKLEYALSEEQLEHNEQVLTYAMTLLELYRQKYGKEPKHINVQFIYAQTKGAAQVMVSEAQLDPAQVRERFKALVAFSNEMLSWENEPFDKVPYNIDSCGLYPPNGCHLRRECSKTGVLNYGDSPEAKAASALVISRIAAQSAPAAKMPDPANREFKTMGKLVDAIMGAGPVALALPSTADPTPPLADVAPEEFSLNPPDGDAEGKSQQLTPPADAPSEAEDDEPEAAESQEPAKPDSDSGYVPTSVELPQNKVRGPAKRDSGAQVRSDALELYRIAMRSPKLLALLRTTATTDKRIANLLADNLKEVTTVAAWRAIRDVLQALVDDNPDEMRTAPVEPVAQEAVSAKSDMLTNDDVEKHLLVTQAHDARTAALHAQTTAKKDLVDAQTRFNEMMSSDTIPEDETERFRIAVLAPAKQRVNSANQQVVDADSALALARSEALKQLVAEAEAARKAKEQEAARPVAPRAEVVQNVAVEDHMPRPQSSSGGFGGPVLVIGAVPTKGTNFVFLTDLLLPYRKRVEVEHGIGWFGLIRGDGEGRIIAAILGDLQAGTLHLPPLVVSGAVPTGLENRAISALRPYFHEVFLSTH